MSYYSDPFGFLELRDRGEKGKSEDDVHHFANVKVKVTETPIADTPIVDTTNVETAEVAADDATSENIIPDVEAPKDKAPDDVPVVEDIPEPEDEASVDWTKYDPPASLRTTPNITSTIILEVVATSMENLKTRIAEENDRRKQEEEEEKRRAAEQEAPEDDGKPKEPYLPIIMVEDRPKPRLEVAAVPDKGKGKDTAVSPIDGRGLIVFPIKPQKGRRALLKRFFQKMERGDENGESSVIGATRNFFRQYQHQRSTSSTDLIPLTPHSPSELGKEKGFLFSAFSRSKTPEEPM